MAQHDAIVQCARCGGERWVCEARPDQPSGHDGCSEPGEPCPVCNTDDPPRPPRGFVSFIMRREPMSEP
jgi:hypothetical protein